MSSSGHCLCGGVKMSLPKDAKKVGDVYCHCTKCSRWGLASAATMAEYHYTEDGKTPVTITAGQELIKDWSEKGVVVRSFCSTCGTHLYCDIPSSKIWTTGPGLWDDKLNFKPVMHAHYEHNLTGIKDGLPKFKNLPEAFGGSGEMMTE